MTIRTVEIDDDEFGALEEERDELIEERDSLMGVVDDLREEVNDWHTLWDDSEQLLIRIGELTHG